MNDSITKHRLIAAVFAGTFFSITLITSLFYNNNDPLYLGMAGCAFIGLLALVICYGRLPKIQMALVPLVLVTLFWIWLCVATLFSDVTYVSLTTAIAFSTLPLTGWAVVGLARTRQFSYAMLTGLVITLVFLALYGCFQFFVLENKPTATFINRNNFAAFLLPVIFLAIIGLLDKNLPKPANVVSGLIIVLFCVVIGLIGSRGALLALGIGSIMTLAAMRYLRWSRKAIVTAAALIIIPLLATNLVTSGSLGERVLSVSDPLSAGQSRFAIWEGSLDMAQAAPWHGFGPGTYFLNYPRYRLDSDRSAAMYAHNDYLQLWIEAGWPAVLLILSGALVAFYLTLNHLFRGTGNSTEKVRAFALISGIAAVMGHSLLTFNLYLVPIIIELGLLFGILTTLLMREGRSEANPVINKSRSSSLVFRLILLAVLAVPATQMTRIIKSDQHFDAGTLLIKEGQSTKGTAQLKNAIDWWPEVDFYYFILAIEQIQQASTLPEPNRSALLKEMKDHLEMAETLNPHRPQPNVVRAMLFKAFKETAPTIDNADKKEIAHLIAAESELRTAVKKNPFYLEARFRLGRLLLEQNRLGEGATALELGLHKPYTPSELSYNYYRLTAEMRRIMGHEEGYRVLLGLVEQTRLALEKRRETGQEAFRKSPGLF